MVPHPAYGCSWLGSLASFEVSQSDFDGFSRNFRPADLRIFGKDGRSFWILYFHVHDFDDAVIDLNVCHGYSPYM